jgi:PAS domain S-box-containing protein
MIRRYGIALLLVGVAFGMERLLRPLSPYPFLFQFFAAVVGSAWYGGTGPALLSVVLSILAVDYFFLPPFHSFAVSATAGAYFAAFIVAALVAGWVSSSKKRNEEALKEARDQLELRVAERTLDLQRSNTELRESEHQLRLLTEVIPQQIWSGTSDGSVDYCNQRLLDYVGRTLPEMQGERLMETIHSEDRERFCQVWQQTLAHGEPFEGEWRVLGAGGEYRWFFTRGVPLLSAEGKPLRWYMTNTDIEERRKAEQALLKTQAELAHLSRALTMGELTASIAHEVNQPLTAVVTYGNACLEWISTVPPNLREARIAAEKIIADGTRAGAVLGAIRALFKKEAPTKEWLDMNGVVQHITSVLRDDMIRNHVSIRTVLSPDLPKVRGDRVQLEQVVLNLIVNAMEAMRATAAKQKQVEIRSREDASGSILISIEDCGVGLTPEIAEKIFDPFFTTKEQGIGLGLSISRSIIEAHEGRLWALPRPSGGAMFQFTLPIGE